MLQRLKNDPQLAFVGLFGACAAIGITPFAVYRASTGQWLIALVDLAIVLGILVAVAHAWRSGDPRRAGLLMALVSTAGCAGVVAMFGSHGLPWVYVVLVANFFLTSRRIALAIGLALLFTPLLRGDLFATPLAVVTFLVTTALVCANAYIFALRTDHQHLQLERLASRDPLTNAGNRRLMEIELADAVAGRAGRDGGCGLALLDLDHFKQVNDACGHEAGDRVLVAFADLLSRDIRLRDRLYRLGGEEFVLLLPGVDDQRLRAALEHLLQRVRDTLRAPCGPVTMSVGAATLRAGESWSEWLARADAALYAAKRGGRDRLVMAGAEAAVVDGASERRRDRARLTPG